MHEELQRAFTLLSKVQMPAVPGGAAAQPATHNTPLCAGALRV